jgi:hypothetical protein
MQVSLLINKCFRGSIVTLPVSCLTLLIWEILHSFCIGSTALEDLVRKYLGLTSKGRCFRNESLASSMTEWLQDHTWWIEAG